MLSKKLMTVGLSLFCVGVLSVAQLYATESENQIIKTNVVYSKENVVQTAVNSDEGAFPKPDPELVTYYRTQVSDALKKYFNLSVKDPNQQDVMIVNDTFANDYQTFLDKGTYSEYDPKTQAKALQEDLAFNKELADGFRERLKEFNHDYALLDYVDDDFSYTAYFNENNKELIMLSTSFEITKETSGGVAISNPASKQPVDPKNFESLGNSFITKYQLGNIKTPKLIASQVEDYSPDIYFAYEDATDASKKVVIIVNPSLQNVCGFYTSSFAENMFKNFFKL
ncbi:MAG: hypothetical protein E7231_16015 [Cellulosilyticum sp.]|nr:hypothetical protein [Cellulosilyticum sp.]